MQVYELFSQNLAHYWNVPCMWPVRVMDCCECNALLLALNCSQHHVRWIDRVNIVGWECWLLFGFLNWLVIKAVCYRDLLQDCIDYALRADCLVRLHTWKSYWRNPLDWLSCSCDHSGTLREPFLDLVSVMEEIPNTFQCYFGKVLRRLVKLCICFEQLSVFELSLYLLASSNECNTIHWSHHSLLNHLSSDFSFQTLCYFERHWVFFILNLLNDQL